MSPGMQLLLTIIGTIFAIVAIVNYRDLIWPAAGRPSPARRRPARSPASSAPAGRPALASSAKQVAKQPEAVSSAISVFPMQENDAEMLAFFAIAKLIQAGMVTETAALQTVFNVRAGSSQAYKEARAKLKHAQDRLSAEHKALSA